MAKKKQSPPKRQQRKNAHNTKTTQSKPVMPLATPEVPVAPREEPKPQLISARPLSNTKPVSKPKKKRKPSTLVEAADSQTIAPATVPDPPLVTEPSEVQVTEMEPNKPAGTYSQSHQAEKKSKKS